MRLAECSDSPSPSHWQELSRIDPNLVLMYSVEEVPRSKSEEVSFSRRAREFVELHDQVETSVNLLNSLETFLSTFQTDLSAVSGQISDLQDRSKDIESRLKSRRKIEKPLSNLLTDLTIPPPLATVILDTRVDESWIPAIENFEHRLDVLRARTRVKAARDLGEVAEGLRIAAATKLRVFFMALLQPIRTSMTTNMQVIQTSVFLKYKPLYGFLHRQAPSVAQEIQKAYLSAARTYYETGFRRYMRSLGWIKARNTEKADTIVSATVTTDSSSEIDFARLEYARIEGPSVTLTYMADDKSYKEPVEALLRSALLVLMDNGTAEYAFVTAFFALEAGLTRTSLSKESSKTLFPQPSSSHEQVADDAASAPASEDGLTPKARQRSDSIYSTSGSRSPANLTKESQSSLNALWKQIMDPALEHTQNFVKASLEPLPSVIPLLTMIRLTEEVMVEIQKRDCPPLETFVFGLRLQMWPLFQKMMTEQVDALKKLAEGASAGYFRRAVETTDALVSTICKRYTTLFLSFVILTEQSEETMIFSNLIRLRQELTKLVETHTEKISDTRNKAKSRSILYEELLQGFSRGFRPAPAHPKAQTEIAYWKEKEEQARKSMGATQGTGSRR
ncbi:vacuolar sorting protein [Dentipellis sp. KUC8613]|nr:vacuolar sorting protein [Dentipellis sp. KUC8613]